MKWVTSDIHKKQCNLLFFWLFNFSTPELS